MNSPSPVATVLSTLAFVVSQGYLAYLLHQLRPNILSLQFTFRSGRYWEILSLWGAGGLQAYRDHFPYDCLHVFVYGSFGYVLATRAGLFAADEQRLARRTAWLLPLAALFDLAENLLQLHLLSGPFGVASPAIPVSALCSSLKWGLAAVFAWRVGWRVIHKYGRSGRASQ